jgi:L-lactate dehydrogenase complex protein LldG
VDTGPGDAGSRQATLAPEGALMAELHDLAPTELRPGEDRVTRFIAELEAVSGTVSRAGRDGLADAVRSALESVGAHRVALTADLGGGRAEVAAALREAGFDVAMYEDVAPDRSTARNLDATVTGCIAAVAATGSILTGGASGRAGALIAPTHVCVVEETRILDGLLATLRLAATTGASAMALQSGPSRTADIEKTLILGMHGPKHVHCVVLDGELG